ncbi:MAG: GtrA family protein [Bacteroidota bacterium]
MPFQVYAYLAVGAVNTVLNIALFAIWYWVIAAMNGISMARMHIDSLAVEIATVISFTVTVFTGFWLSKNFAFADASNEKKEKTKQFGKYFLVSLQGQFSDYLITKGLIVLLLVKPVGAYFISTFIMLLVNYFLQRYYTFKTKNSIAAI